MSGASSRLVVTHEHGRSIGVGVGEVEIARYVYAEDIPAFEAPRPYLHPLRTLSGALVTGYRPWDHRWHRGLSMTWSHVSGQNFWGGPSYVDGRGYVARDNVGRIQHEGFAVIDHDPGEAGRLELGEYLTWITASGQQWLAEDRRLLLHQVDPGRGCYALDVRSDLHNISGQDLDLGSPTTHGRPAAGYTGWFWRGPRSLTGARVLTGGVPLDSDPEGDGSAGAGSAGFAASDGTGADGGDARAMGTRSAWLACTGPNDGLDGEVTLLVLAGRCSRARAHWFVRSEPFPAIAPSPAFHQPIVLPPQESLTLEHRFVIADGAWSRERIEAYLADTPQFGPPTEVGQVGRTSQVGLAGQAAQVAERSR